LPLQWTIMALASKQSHNRVQTRFLIVSWSTPPRCKKRGA